DESAPAARAPVASRLARVENAVLSDVLVPGMVAHGKVRALEPADRAGHLLEAHPPSPEAETKRVKTRGCSRAIERSSALTSRGAIDSDAPPKRLQEYSISRTSRSSRRG